MLVYGKTYKEVKEKLFKEREQLLEKGGHGCSACRPYDRGGRRDVAEDAEAPEGIHTFHLSFHYREAYILPLIGSVPAEAWDFAAYREYFKISAEGKQGKKFRAVSAPDTHYFRTDSQFLKDKYHCNRAGTAPHAPLPRQTQASTSPLETDIRKLEAYLQKEAPKGMLHLGILPTAAAESVLRTVCPEMGDISFEKGTMHIGRTLQRIRTFCSNSEEAGCYSTGTKIITSPKIR